LSLSYGISAKTVEKIEEDREGDDVI